MEVKKIIYISLDAPGNSVILKDFYNNVLNEDSTLAFYNIENNSFIELSLK